MAGDRLEVSLPIGARPNALMRAAGKWGPLAWV
jgi:hypothetical protein